MSVNNGGREYNETTFINLSSRSELSEKWSFNKKKRRGEKAGKHSFKKKVKNIHKDNISLFLGIRKYKRFRGMGKSIPFPIIHKLSKNRKRVWGGISRSTNNTWWLFSNSKSFTPPPFFFTQVEFSNFFFFFFFFRIFSTWKL